MQGPSLVSVVIVNWNGAEFLRECLKSVRSQTWPSVEVLVVDNASEDHSLELIRSFEGVRVLALDKNVGFAQGNNLGFETARGEYIALLNNDSVAEPRWLETCLSLFETRSEVAAVGCTVREWRGESPPLDPHAPINTSWTKVDPRTGAAFNYNDLRAEAANDYLAGCAMVVRRRVIDEVGFLDPDYEAYYEETDWNARMIRAGYTMLFTPRTWVWHRVQASSRKRGHDYNQWMMCRNRVRFVLKNFDLPMLPLFGAAYVREMAAELWRATWGARPEDPVGRADRRRQARFLWRALLWNAGRLPGTIKARRRDLERLARSGNIRSYNRNLPLRHVAPNR